MPMNTIEQILSDTYFRRFFFKWAPQIFIGGLALFSSIGLAALTVLYLGMQNLSGTSAGLVKDFANYQSSMSAMSKDIAANTAAVTTLTVDQGRSNARIQIYQSDVSEIIQRLDELMQLINANEMSSALKNRRTELELLIRLDEFELRRIQAIKRSSDEDPTDLETEAENSLIKSLSERRDELRSLRGF